MRRLYALDVIRCERPAPGRSPDGETLALTCEGIGDVHEVGLPRHSPGDTFDLHDSDVLPPGQAVLAEVTAQALPVDLVAVGRNGRLAHPKRACPHTDFAAPPWRRCARLLDIFQCVKYLMNGRKQPDGATLPLPPLCGLLSG